MNQAVAFSNNLVQRSSSSDIMQSKENLKKRFEDLSKTPGPALPVSSYLKFVSTAEPENLALGVTAIGEPMVEGPTQDFQAGAETEFFIISPKLINEGLFVVSLCLFNIVKLVNRSCDIVERNDLFNLWAVEKDLSTDALVAGFTNISLHTEITLLISFLSGVGNFL